MSLLSVLSHNQWRIHNRHYGWCWVENLKFVPLDALKLHSMALRVLRFLCKTFSKLLEFTLQNTLLLVNFVKNSYVQIKNLHGSKLVRAPKRSELKRGSKWYRRNHTKQSKLFTKKEKQIFAWSNTYLN